MTIPVNITKLFIFRAPHIDENYSIFSEDKSYLVEAAIGSKDIGTGWKSMFKTGWIVVFKSPAGETTAIMASNSLTYRFMKNGADIGWVDEAPLSVAGKSLVKNEAGESIGSVVSRFTTTRFLSADDKEIGVARRYREGKMPLFLGPSKAHLVQRYVLERFNGSQLDERLLFCFVCNLVATEKSGSAS